MVHPVRVGADDGTSADELAGLEADFERSLEKVWQVQTEPARDVIASVRELLAGFGDPPAITVADLPRSDGKTTSGSYLPTFTRLVGEPSGLSQYHALAMLAVCVHGWSQETGRSASEILDDLASNFES